MVDGIVCQQVAKVTFPEYNDMVDAFASDRTDQPLNVTVLPRRPRRDRSISNSHGSQSARDRDTSGDPIGGRICSHVGPGEPSPLQPQDDHPVEKLEPDRRNDEQIDGGDVGGVIAQEGTPAR